MTPRLKFALTVGLCVSLVLATTSVAFAAVKASPRATSSSPPGLEAAKTISLITGVAISPLLGIGGVGVYKWWHTPEERRPRLPWYAQPWFWVPALLLVAIVGIKDIAGTAAPSVLKKPFDVAEAIENKISALIAAGAFLPLIVTIFPEATGDGTYLSPAGLGFAALDGGAIMNALLTPFAMLAFAVIWLASHAVNMLILISPFTTLDTALKGLRLALLGLVTATAFINPYLGAAISVLVFVFAYLIAGWSFRLTVFGTCFAWDYATVRRRRFQPGSEANPVFTGRKLPGVPARTYGWLVRESGGMLAFKFRPWLVLPRRTVPVHQTSYVVGKGIFCPEIDRVEGERLTTMFVLPPRYQTHEEALARVYNFEGVREVGVLRGIKSGWAWLRGLFGRSVSLVKGSRAASDPGVTVVSPSP